MGLFNFNKKTSSSSKNTSISKLSLPKDYINLIESLCKKTYALAYIEHPKLEDLDFSCFIPIDKSIKRNAYYIYEEIIKNPNLFPFAENDFGDFYCFDLVNNHIVLWYHETKKTVNICNIFTEFLNMIKTN